jgi:hypothetical protein
VIVGIDAQPGQQVSPGARLATIDAGTLAPSAALLNSDERQLAWLAIGQRVSVHSATGGLTGRISGIEPVASRAGEVARRWVVPVAGLPEGTSPVWVVQIAPDPGSVVPVLGGAVASVSLPTIRPYQLIFGKHR